MNKPGRWKRILICVGLGVLFSLPLMAQSELPSSHYPKVTIYNYPEDVIDADLQTPDARPYHVLNRDRRLRNLVRYQEDFRDKILRSVNNL